MRIRKRRPARATRATARESRFPRLLGAPPAFDGDFDDGEAVTEVIASFSAESWGGASGAGLRDDDIAAMYGPRPFLALPAGTAPRALPPPSGGSWTQSIMPVTVTAGEKIPAGAEALGRVQATLTYLSLKVEILARRGHLDRVSEDALDRLPRLRRQTRTTAKIIIGEASELLCPPPDPWEPMPLHMDMSRPQPWHRSLAGAR